MKKINKSSNLAIIAILSLLFTNCNRENIETTQQTITPELIGKIHNDALDNILLNEHNFNFKTTENEFKVQIIKENYSYLNSRIINFKLPNSKIEESVKLLNTEKLLSKNFSTYYAKNNSFTMDESNIFDKIEFIRSSKIISDEDKIVLDELFTAYQKNYQGLLSNEELLKLAKKIRSDYINNNIDQSKQNVLVSLSVIEICVNSLEWFEENINSLQNKAYKNNNQQKILFWNIVAADAIGAIVGIGESIITQGIKDSNSPVNGEDVLTSALWGAVGGSVGSVLKVGGWLAKLF